MAAFGQANELPGLEMRGIAVHIGSQLTDLAPLENAFGRVGELIRDLRSAGHAIGVADLGGGLGVSYDPSLPHPPTPAAYGEMVARITRDWGVRLVFEPGRLLVGNAGVLLTRVIRVKPGRSRPFVIVDAAMNDLMRPTLYDAWHGIEAVEPPGDMMRADIVGPVCESGDTFAKARDIDRVEAGELMVIRSAGAYAATMGSNYNSRTLPAEVLVDGAEWAVVRERQQLEALVKGEMLPPWLPAIPGVQA
jgi:diaminopimelate decarboxylase